MNNSNGVSDKIEIGVIGQFQQQVQNNPELPAVTYEETGERVTYSELNSLMEQYKFAFLEKGITKEDKVGLLLQSNHKYIAAFYALASIGVLLIIISPSLTEYEINQMITDSNPDALVTSENLSVDYKNVIEENDAIESLFLIEKSNEEQIDSKKEVIYLNDYEGKKSFLSDPPDDSVITCHYTYKGYGYSLGVLNNYYGYGVCVEGFKKMFPYKPGSTCLVALPLYPILGTVILMMFNLSSGGNLLIVSKIMKKNIIKLFEDHHVRFTCLVPVIVKKMLEEAQGRDVDSFNFHPEVGIACGGEYLDKKIISKTYEALGLKIQQGYGLTEGRISLLMEVDKFKKGSLGSSFCRDTRIRILRADGTEAGIGETGELVISGPILGEGYLSKPVETAKYFRNGKLFTRDLAYKDIDGSIFYVGRSAPITKIYAQMVDLTEIDRILESHPFVEKAKTINIGPDGENYISSTVMTLGQKEITVDELKDFLKGFLSRHKIPEKIIIHDSQQC